MKPFLTELESVQKQNFISTNKKIDLSCIWPICVYIYIYAYIYIYIYIYMANDLRPTEVPAQGTDCGYRNMVLKGK